MLLPPVAAAGAHRRQRSKSPAPTAPAPPPPLGSPVEGHSNLLPLPTDNAHEGSGHHRHHSHRSISPAPSAPPPPLPELATPTVDQHNSVAIPSPVLPSLVLDATSPPLATPPVVISPSATSIAPLVVPQVSDAPASAPPRLPARPANKGARGASDTGAAFASPPSLHHSDSLHVSPYHHQGASSVGHLPALVAATLAAPQLVPVENVSPCRSVSASDALLRTGGLSSMMAVEAFARDRKSVV